MEITLAIAWILFLALFPIAFYWLRRAYRIFIKQDFSEVALKGGETPPNVERFAPYTGTINFVSGGVVICIIIGVLVGKFAYQEWVSAAGITIWGKLLADFIVSRQARFSVGKKS